MSVETYRLHHMGRDYEYQQQQISLDLTGWSVTTEGPGFHHIETGLTRNDAYDTAREWQKHAYVQESEWTVSITATEGEWLVDFGDGSPVQQLPVGDTPTCYLYTEPGTYVIGVYQDGNERMYTSRTVTVPQTMTVTVDPESGEVPLDVTLTISGATTQPTVNWGD